MTTVLRTATGDPIRRVEQGVLYCGRCFEELAKTKTGATYCPTGCPP